jgi:tetratricopeptide (TPR) repeat protein
LPVDWNVVASALQHSRDGQNLKALAILQGAMQEAETDRDRAAIVLGEASCYSQLGNIMRSRELLESAKTFAGADRAVLSQVELSEASLDALEKKYGIACEKFAALKSKYHDLLVQPENDDFALELDSRLACTLVDAGKCSEAIPIFRQIFERGELEDKQRLQVFFGAALLRVGRSAEAQPILFEAARGANTELSQTALQYLSAQKSEKML